MRNRYKIALSISFMLTLFFALPWISLVGEDYLQQMIPKGNGWARLGFLAGSVFLSSVLFFQYNLLWDGRLMRASSGWSRRVLHVFINLILIVVVSLAVTRISAYFFDLKRTFFAFALFRNLLIAAVSMLVAYAYEVMEQSKEDRIKYLMLHNEKVETELAMLKTQIDPHFLFNSLNSLTGVIRTNPKEAVHFVNHLSETFRYVLDHRWNNLVPLHHELAFLNAYLYLMKVRFGDGLVVRIEIEERFLSRKIPQYGLQLLVENAVKHNIVSEKRPLQIHITASESSVEVRNNLQLKSQSVKGYGIGLANLNKQYDLLGKPPLAISRTDIEFRVNLHLI